MEMSKIVSFKDIEEAYQRIKPYIKFTEFSRSDKFSEEYKIDVLLKHDYRQITGSFKERGALNYLLMLNKEQREMGVVAASAGNHALGLSYHGKKLSIPITVCIPETAPIVKIERCKKLGAQVILKGKTFDEAKSFAIKYAAENNLKYVDGFNDPNIIAGQGTIMLEIAKETQNLDAVIVPVGGGGLIAGIAIATKKLFPACQIIGVEPSLCASMEKALKEKKPVTLDSDSSLTIADGLGVRMIGSNALDIILPLYNQMLQVDESDIFNAIFKLIELERCVIEGAGAAGVAALVCGKLNHLQNKKVAIIVCGSNIDSITLTKVIDRALCSNGRLVNISLLVSDRPGGLREIIEFFNEHQISIRDIYTERVSIEASVYLCKVNMCLELQSSKQSVEFKRLLYDRYGAKLTWNSF